jgi:CheY-like chemotaxis protein
MKRRILVIEDNPDSAEMLKETLELLGGHAVQIAFDGPSALAMARTFHPEIVLCDIGLPGMNGFEVAQAIRAEPSLGRVFLIALSGYTSPEDQQRAIEAGFDRHLGKPASWTELEEAVANSRAPRPE